MKIPLSNRLLACAKFVKPGERIADIGCDHGYLTLYLLHNNIASSAIAADINEMPLKSARSNAEKYGYSDKISFHLSNGAQNIPTDFDVMICAGMGADTIISILTDAHWLKDPKYRLILQCQSKTPQLRKYLSDNGWFIDEEHVLQDGRFLYTIMNISFEPNKPRLTNAQCYITPALLQSNSDKVKEYCSWVIEGLKIQTLHRDDPHLNAILNNLIKENLT